MTSNNQEIRRLGEADAAPEGRQSPHQQSIFRRHHLSEVDLALYNEMKGTRDVLSDSLSGIGFRPFCTNVVSVLEKLRSTVRRGDIDMLMLEANRQSRAFYNLVHEIRNDKLGRDPFLVISIVTWRADKALIQAFLKAGADLLSPPAISGRTGALNRALPMTSSAPSPCPTACATRPPETKAQNPAPPACARPIALSRNTACAE